MIGVDFLNVFYHEDYQATNFSAQLFRLLAKADEQNRAKLRKVYPAHVELYEWWMDNTQPPDREAILEMAKTIEKEHSNESTR